MYVRKTGVFLYKILFFSEFDYGELCRQKWQATTLRINWQRENSQVARFGSSVHPGISMGFAGREKYRHK
jgi:hypothetical protein